MPCIFPLDNYSPLGFDRGTYKLGIGPVSSFFLNFLGGALPSGTSFTRASNADQYNSSGVIVAVASNVARFDYNPSTLVLNGVLIEPQSTNILSPSVPGSGWNMSFATLVANAVSSPDGGTNGATLTDNSTTGAHYTTCPSTLVIVISTVYTLSAYFKAGTETVVQLVLGGGFDNNNFYANFNLAAGTIGTVGSSVTAKMQAINNGWYRCSITGTSLGVSGAANAAFAHANNNASSARLPSYSGSGSVFSLWGAQMEASAVATSYIPTTTITTRLADALSFTIPAGVGHLIYTFENNSTQTVTVSAGAYTVPTNLNQPWIETIRGTP